MRLVRLIRVRVHALDAEKIGCNAEMVLRLTDDPEHAVQMLLAQELDGARRHPSFVPANAFEERGGSPGCIEDIELNSVSIHQRSDEVHAQLEMPAE